MENFAIQINIITVSLVIIALILVAMLSAVLFLLFTFYFKFSARISKIIENLEATSYKTVEMANLLSDQVYKVNDRINILHSVLDETISTFLYFSNFIYGLKLPSFLSSIFSLFTSKDKSYNENEEEATESEHEKPRSKNKKRRGRN